MMRALSPPSADMQLLLQMCAPLGRQSNLLHRGHSQLGLRLTFGLPPVKEAHLSRGVVHRLESGFQHIVHFTKPRTRGHLEHTLRWLTFGRSWQQRRETRIFYTGRATCRLASATVSADKGPDLK